MSLLMHTGRLNKAVKTTLSATLKLCFEVCSLFCDEHCLGVLDLLSNHGP
jgi:hypothetical protein